MLDGIMVPIETIIYDFISAVAGALWGINQALLTVAYYLMTLTGWLTDQMFVPMMGIVSQQADALLPSILIIAFLLMAITYSLGVFGVYQVVDLKSALQWFVVAVFLLNYGPQIYSGIDTMRRSLSTGFYTALFAQLDTNSNTIEGLDAIINGDSGNLQVAPLQNNFGPYLPTYDISIDGTDAALAYFAGTGCDVLRAPGCTIIGELPVSWYTPGSGYFDTLASSTYFPTMTSVQRQESIRSGMDGLWILFSGITLSIFATIEAVINLCLAIAFAFGFVSLFIAILFAFFKRTESITMAAFDVILALFIQSIINALLLAMIMAFVLIAAGTGNGFLLFGISFIGIILLVVLLMGAVQAILQSLNGMVNAFAAATGGNLGAAGTVTSIAGTLATGGATAAMTGSVTQAAGAMLGPGAAQKAYYASQTFGEDSLVGQVAQDFATGGFASSLGPVGILGLSQTRPNFQQFSGLADGVDYLNTAMGSPIRVRPQQLPDLPEPETRLDPISASPYEFVSQQNGQSYRQYEDGSRLNTNVDDVPSNSERALQEQFALGGSVPASSGVTPDIRTDVLSGQAYQFTELNNGGGQRQYEDGSRLSTSADDVPNDGERARSERRTRSQWIEDNAEEEALLERRSAVGQQAFLEDLDAEQVATATPTLATQALSIPSIDEASLTISDERLNLAQVNIQDDGGESNDMDTSREQGRASYSEPPPASLDYLSAQEGADYSDYSEPRGYLDDKEHAVAYSGAQSDDQPDQEPKTSSVLPAITNPAPERVSVFEQANVGDNPIRQLHGVGATTEKKMTAMGIETVGQLANSSVEELSQAEGFSPSRSAYFIRSAQQHMGNDQAHVIAPSTNAQEIASAVDNSNNDDNARMVTGISSSVAQALSASEDASLTPAQSSLLAPQYGLPAKEGGDYLALSRAMQLAPAQSASVLQTVANQGDMGADLRASIQASLGQLQTSSGQSLDSSGIQRAIMGLEQAAQGLANTMQTGSAVSAPEQQLEIDAQVQINTETGD